MSPLQDTKAVDYSAYTVASSDALNKMHCHHTYRTYVLYDYIILGIKYQLYLFRVKCFFIKKAV